MQRSSDRVGATYIKARFVEYTTDSFTARSPRPPQWTHLHLLGPLIRGVVGDTIIVVLRNNASVSVSFHPHGLQYNKSSEGSLYNDATGPADKADDSVAPGQTHTYVYTVPASAGPTATATASSVVWGYHSNVDRQRDIAAGLVGPIIIASPDAITDTQRSESGVPDDVDQEFVLYASIVDENESYLLGETMGRFGVSASLSDSGFIESNRKHSING